MVNKTQYYAFLLLLKLWHTQGFTLLPTRNGAVYQSTTPLWESSDSDQDDTASARVYLEMEVANEAIGRLEFEIPNVNLLPLHTENLLKLCTQARVGIDPRCKYVGCEFKHSPQFVEGFAQYRWGHELQGRGRNAIGRADERITDPENLSKCTHAIYNFRLVVAISQCDVM